MFSIQEMRQDIFVQRRKKPFKIINFQKQKHRDQIDI